MSHLPIELEREIFKLMYFVDPTQAMGLMLVAKRVHIWFVTSSTLISAFKFLLTRRNRRIEPLIYRIFQIGDSKIFPRVFIEDGTTRCHSRTLNVPLLKRFGGHARHILFRVLPVDDIVQILKYCPSVTNIAFWAIRGILHTHLKPLLTSFSNLTYLSFDPSCFFINYEEDGDPIPFHLPMFRNISCLEIINVTPSWNKWRELAQIPHLTTLRLAGSVSRDLVSNILLKCDALQTLVVYLCNWKDDVLNEFNSTNEEVRKGKRILTRVYEDDLAECWVRWAKGITSQEG